MPTGPPTEGERKTSGEAGTVTDSRLFEIDPETSTGWPTPISAAALGESHSLVLAGGRVMSFGEGMVISEDLWIDRLGFEAAHHPRFTPTEIPGLTDVEDVCAGRIFSLALLKNGTVLTWGQQYGAESVTDFYQLPSEVDPPEAGQWNGRVVGIACGATYSAVWTDKGALYTWGSLSGSTNLKQLKEKGNLQKRPPMAMACHPPGKEGIPRPTQVEHLRDVKVLGAVGHRNHLLVIPEDRGMFFLCSNHAGLGKPEDEQKSTAPPAQRFVLRSAGGIENPKVVGVALGDLPGANVTLRFVLLILEGNGRRRLFALDPDGKQELIEQGTPLYEVKFSDNGVPLDVVEVSVQKNRALVLLSDSTVKVLTLYLVDDQVFFGEPMPVEALRNSSLKLPKAISLGTNWIVITRTGPKGPFLPKEELAWGRGQYGIGRYKSSESLRTFEPLERPALAKGRWCRLPEKFNFKRGRGRIDRYPKEVMNQPKDKKTGFPVYPDLVTRNSRGKEAFRPHKWLELGDMFRYSCDGTYQWNFYETGVFYPPEVPRMGGSNCTHRRGTEDGEPSMDPPLDEIECRGCEVPPEWLPTPNGTSSRSSTLPLFITGMSYVSPLNVEFPFNPEAPVGLKWQLHFDCPTGVLSSTKAHCMNLYDRAVFSPNSTELFCTGCAVPDFRSSEVFPLRVEVRKKTEDGDHSAETAGTEAEGEEGWREYEKGEAIGVGDRLRLLCDSGTLAAAATESAVSDRKADEQLSSSGVECQWRDEKDKQKRTEYPTFKDTQDTSYLFCKGCSVPRAWLRGEQLWVDSRFTVEATSIRRKGSDETESLQENMTTGGGIGINDTIFFSCPKGGVLRVDDKARVRGGATCVDPFGKREFDLEVSAVKCVRSATSIFLEICFWTLLVLVLGVAVGVFIWYGWKEKWRRRRIARRLNLQRVVVPPEGADVREMVREKPRSLAE